MDVNKIKEQTECLGNKEKKNKNLRTLNQIYLRYKHNMKVALCTSSARVQKTKIK